VAALLLSLSLRLALGLALRHALRLRDGDVDIAAPRPADRATDPRHRVGGGVEWGERGARHHHRHRVRLVDERDVNRCGGGRRAQIDVDLDIQV